MDKHLRYLDTFCRLCGDKITKGSRKRYPVRSSASKLMENNIYISNDDPEIHPKWMCAACRCSLTVNPRVSRLLSWKRVVWSKHNDVRCPTCTLGDMTAKVGRPKKLRVRIGPITKPLIPLVPSSLSSLESDECNPRVHPHTLGESPEASLFANIDIYKYAIELRCKYCHCLVHINNVNTHSCTTTMTSLAHHDDTVTSSIGGNNPPPTAGPNKPSLIHDERPPMVDGGWVIADEEEPIPISDQGHQRTVARQGHPPPIANQHDPPPKRVVPFSPSKSRNVVLLTKDNFVMHCKQCNTSVCIKNMKDHVCASKEAVERDHSYSRTNTALIDLTPQDLEDLTYDVLRKKWKESDDGSTAILSTGGGGSGKKICAKRVKISDLQVVKERVKIGDLQMVEMEGNEKKMKSRHTSTQTVPQLIHLLEETPIPVWVTK